MTDFSMLNDARIVVFTGDFSHSVRKGIAEIGRANPGLTWLVIIQSPKKSPVQLLRNQWRNLRQNGWRWIPYQVGELGRRLCGRAATPVDPHAPGFHLAESALKTTINVQLHKVADIHGDSTLEVVQAFQPDLGISLAAPILRQTLFSIPRLGTLNLHKGKLPSYRGMPPAFWELWNDEQSVGCTVHWVEKKLDAGDVVLESYVDREKYSTVRGLQLRLDEAGIDLMRDAVAEVLRRRARSIPQPGGGMTYRKPTLAQTTALTRKLLVGQIPADTLAKQIVKNVAASSAMTLWPFGIPRFFSPRVTVLLYHRVTDGVRDNLTVGIEQFDRQMSLLRKHCRVLSIEDILSLDNLPQSHLPMVCVTFDDGYLDNYTNAAQILLRHRIPAAFFVSTGLIGTDRSFPHDVRRGNPPIPMMNWKQLETMRAWGFTIGSHSVNHIDCAAESEETVRRELAQSRDDLQHKLGLREVLFAYPYGGRTNMTPERLALVKQAGYISCLSAYGGANVRRVDPFNVLRRGINWEFSDKAFLLQCLGLK